MNNDTELHWKSHHGMGISGYSPTGILRTVLGAMRLLITTICSWISPPKRGKIPPITKDILLYSATNLAEKIRNKELRSTDVVKCFIDRLKEVNPLLNAMVEECFLLALEEAKQVDSFIGNSGKTPEELAKEKPLLGVPVTIKSNISCKGMLHESGLVARKGTRADSDATVTSLVKQAGAILLGITNIPELATSYNSYNKIYGQTKNPHDLTKTSGGSSGGESSLVSAGASVIGIGNDLCGSLRMPACVTGIFAHKPTSGIVSNEGMFPPVAPDTSIYKVLVQGPLCRYGKDLTTMMKVLTGPSADKLFPNTTVDFRKLTILYCDDDSENPFADPIDEEIKISMKRVLAHFHKKFGVQHKKVSFPDAHQVPWIIGTQNKTESAVKYTSILANDEKKEVKLYLELPKCLLGLSNHTFDSLSFAIFNQTISGSDEQVQEYRRIENKLRRDYKRLFDENTVLLCSSWPKSSSSPVECMYQTLNMTYYTLFGLIGAPVTQCPVGVDRSGYPIGLQVASAPYQDNLTIAVAREIESAFGGWQKPCEVEIQAKF